MNDFTILFRRATNLPDPFPYQQRLAMDQSLPQLLNVPTGLGKTAAVVLAWIWRRRFSPDQSVRDNTARRLVYCLPMRVLVEQTASLATAWLANLNLSQEVCVNVLMGGEEAGEWDLYPERDAIVIGTQDMLLSRALNRGYAMSRYRWPMQFGLLHNDCLWVFDEVQLMDVGAATSAQLEAFRRSMDTSNNAQCMWMSATLEPDWLHTVDIQREWLGEPFGLTENDKKLQPVRNRYEAVKPIERAAAQMGDTQAIAEAIRGAHQPASLTLAVFNTVARARQVYKELQNGGSQARFLLIHSRFRPPDRQEKMKQLLDNPPPEGTIVSTTQVVEAGVDVSAKTLLTELAPWASLVQRFGRCNRGGEFNKTRDARVSWFDADDESLDNLAPPYEAEELRTARAVLQNHEDVGPISLRRAGMRLEPSHVIRRRDLLDLFDTTPDLAGNDIDVSRFIRSGEELDVQVFWRDWHRPKGYEPPPDEKAWRRVGRDELCSAPVGEFKKFATDPKRKTSIWRWDPLDGEWTSVDKGSIYPGQSYLIHVDAGGYDASHGWIGTASRGRVDPLGPVEPRGFSDDAYDDEDLSETEWQTIAEHTDDVVRELEAILTEMSIDDNLKKRLQDAARWHDLGKAHAAFVAKLKPDALAGAPLSGSNGRHPAKAPRDAWRSWQELRRLSRQADQTDVRPHFRHELASALAMLQIGMDDLVVYLVAAHHGKVRLSIRSLPGEKPPDGDPIKLYARGVWDGDELPAVQLGAGVTAGPVTLSLQCMQLGRSQDGEPSWAERMLKLRDTIGPFRLAYLEALLRAADMRASRFAAEQQESTP